MRRPARRLKNEINVVPYIDVMLVLLVIFMVAAPMMQTGSIDLPTVEKANVPPDHPLRVEVGADGGFRIVRENSAPLPVLPEDLAKMLREEQRTNPDLAVLVAGDKSARYETVLQALEAIKSIGIGRVGLETARK
ncbi:MAG: ExbD/TolR family protein [Zoogloeaceae bacterium]|jgi:biopolymer transport protein TolR|nr:ExbD/TolR family protein [Zoogloeaceae bacterium]